MNKLTEKDIVKLLDTQFQQNPEAVERFAAYCVRLSNEPKNKTDPTLKNPWMQGKKASALAGLYKRVLADGLFFDGVHITLQSNGVSYDYVAFKNKMLLTYPESEIDVQLVYDKDEFESSKDSGIVHYNHKMIDPFKRKDDQIVGGYCVIKNKRGQFITLLNKEDFEKHKLIAKTKNIWENWYPEMCMKTLIKKACNQHFKDIYEGINELDNENYSLEKIEIKRDPVMERAIALIADCDTEEEVQALAKELGGDYAELLIARETEIKSK